MEIIHLIDANRKLCNDIANSEIGDKDIVIDYIDSLGHDLDDILYRNNVEEFASDNNILIQNLKQLLRQKKLITNLSLAHVQRQYHLDTTEMVKC